MMEDNIPVYNFDGFMPEEAYELLNALQIMIAESQQSDFGTSQRTTLDKFIQKELFPNNKLGKKIFTRCVAAGNTDRNGRCAQLNLIAVPEKTCGSFSICLQMVVLEAGETLAESRLVPLSDFNFIPQQICMDTMAERFVYSYTVSPGEGYILSKDTASLIRLISEAGMVSFKLGRTVYVGEFIESGTFRYIKVPCGKASECTRSIASCIRDMSLKDDIDTETADFIKDLRSLYAMINLWINRNHVKELSARGEYYQTYNQHTVNF